MILPALSPVWQKPAQNQAWSSLAFSVRTVWHRVIAMMDASSKASVCTTYYRYPSPSKQFGPRWAGLLFFVRKSVTLEQKTAESGMIDSGDSFWIHTLLYLPVIKTNRGRKQCRSNIWLLQPFSLRRLPAVWTTTLSVRPQGPLRGPLSRRSWAAVCLPVRSSGRVLAHFATMSACVTKTTNNARAALGLQSIRNTLTIVGLALRWLFFVWQFAAAQIFTKIYELARAQRWRVGSEKTGAVMAQTIFGKA